MVQSAMRMGPRAWAWRVAAGALIVAFLVIVYRAPALFVGDAWLSDPYYTHGIPVALAAVGLGAWRVLRRPQERAPAWAPFLLLVPAAMYGAGLLRGSPYLLVWSALALAAALAFAWGRAAALAPSLLLFALTLPTPWTFDVGVALQQASTAAAGAILGLFGLGFRIDLTTLQAGDVSFEVTPACSGFQSAISLLAIAAVIACVAPMTRRRAALVVGLALPLAIVLNVARILGVIAVGLRWGSDAAEGFFHGASDLILFLAQTLALVAIAGLFRRPKVMPSG